METVWSIVCWVAFKSMIAGFLTPFDWLIRAEISKPTLPFGIMRWCMTGLFVYLWWIITPESLAWQYAFHGDFLGLSGFAALMSRGVLLIIGLSLWQHCLRPADTRTGRIMGCVWNVFFMLYFHFVIASYTMPA